MASLNEGLSGKGKGLGNDDALGLGGKPRGHLATGLRWLIRVHCFEVQKDLLMRFRFVLNLLAGRQGSCLVREERNKAIGFAQRTHLSDSKLRDAKTAERKGRGAAKAQTEAEDFAGFDAEQIRCS